MKILPYGTWPSAITPAAIAAGTMRLSSVSLVAGRIGWLEGRLDADGHNIFVQTDAQGRPRDITSPRFNVRSRVHEYGGGAYAVAGDRIWFSNDADGRVYVQTVGAAPTPLTAPGAEPGRVRFADLTIDLERRRLLAVREEHRGDEPPINDLVEIAMTDGSVRVLASGHDFFAAPAPSPDGRQLAWLAWDQPDMPWDTATLWLAGLDRDGIPAAPIRIAGGSGTAVFQPAWSPGGELWCVADPQGWWNLHCLRDGVLQCMYRFDREFAKPLWQLGATTFGFDARGHVVCTWRDDDGWRLGRLDADGIMTPVALPWTDIDALHVEGSIAAFIGGAPDRSAAVVSIDLASGATRVHREANTLVIDDRVLSRPVAFSYPTAGGRMTAHGFHYPPHHAACRAPVGDTPPLLVVSHGGPTGAASHTLNPMIQFWTSRGFAVLDVDYRGSTGYGRAYREQLYGEWGVADVEDCVAGAMYLVEMGQADRNRLVIRGSSAGGYTTLAALTSSDVFRAGASYYGICDLEALVNDTHKFEARYLDRLVGPWPEHRAVYRARSPLHHAARLRCPVIFFQGCEDRVVPLNQTERMAAALEGRGLPVAVLIFAEEGHGFRRAETIRRCLEAELFFYGRVLGFEPADTLTPVDIRNLPIVPDG